MIKVVTSLEMQDLDQIAMRQFGIQGLILMENAALGVVSFIIEKYGDVEDKTFFIFCGKGNNGGDGFAVARHLYNRKANVRTFIIGKRRDLRGDALINSNILNRMFNERKSNIVLTVNELNSIKDLKQYSHPDIIIDAIFGTGIKGNIEGLAKEVIDFISLSNKPVVSIDIPSGLNGTTGEYGNVSVKANMTVTMALPKVGLLINKGPDLCGDLKIADISMPKSMILKYKSKTFLVEKEDLTAKLPKRAYDAHKYSCGKVFVLAGSVGLTGAACMCAESALKSGAGAVILGIPESLNNAMEEKLTEVMTVPLPETSDKTFSMKGMKSILDYANNWADVILIGPGVSQNRETKKLILNLLPQIKKPVVLDADGLNNLQDDIDVLKKFDYELIITPHYGELSRIIKVPPAEIAKNRIDISRKVAKENALTLILKGAPSVVADRDENVYINPTGNAGMATAGSGDVLSGIVAGLFAQVANPVVSATLGMYLHGLAGNIARDKYGEHSLVATDIMKNLHKAIIRLSSIKTAG